MKTIEQFYNEIIASEELAKKLEEAAKSQKFDEFLKENEVEGTVEQFREYVLEREKNSEQLSDENLESVAGGMPKNAQCIYIKPLIESVDRWITNHT